MYIDNMLLLANPDYYDYGKDTYWYSGGTWGDNTVYTIGSGRVDTHKRFRCPIPGVKTRVEIDFEFYQGPAPIVFPVYLVTNGAAEPQQAPNVAIATAYTAAVSGLQTIVFDNVSFDAETFYLVFLGDHYQQFKIKEVRARTSYEVQSSWSVIIANEFKPTDDPKIFYLYVKPGIGTYNPFDIQTAAFYWRLGETGVFTSAPMTVRPKTSMYSQALASVEIPGGTFSVGNIYWYIAGVGTDGENAFTIITPTRNFVSNNGYLIAQAVSPKDGFWGNNEPITFEWSLRSYSPNDVGGTDLQYSIDGVTWIDLASVILVDYSSRFYTAPANTIPAGTIYWRVRAIGPHGAVGLWSDAVTFEALGASVVTNLAASAVPFSTVSWEVTGELAYRIMVDNALFGPYCDPNAMSYTLAEPLSDGEHVVKVAAQNKYGLWSAWAETTVTIANVPGTTVLITEAAGSGAGTAALTITGGEQTGDFLIYRDGVLIGRTADRSYTDRTAAPGSHEYYVLQVLPGGYYTKSNVVTLTGYVDCPAIALLSGGEFLLLELSEDANRTQTITKTGDVAYIQYSGAKYPEAEIGEAESLTATGDVSFTEAQEADARRFEAMLKKAVIYKVPGGEVVVGILQGFTRRDPRFFKSYGFQVTQMEWRDFTNA